MSFRLAALLVALLPAAYGPAAEDIATVCAAYTEAVERLAELEDTMLVDPWSRVEADRICDET